MGYFDQDNDVQTQKILWENEISQPEYIVVMK